MYLHPAQFYLFISVIFFFFLSFNAKEQQLKFDSFHIDFAKSNDENLIIMNKKIDKEKLDSLIAINASEEEIMKLMGLKE